MFDGGLKDFRIFRDLAMGVRVFGFGLCLMANLPGHAADPATENPTNPVVATYDGGVITLHELEEFAREMPLATRIPFARRAAGWRHQMAGELAKSTELTSQALRMGLQMDPAYLRGRDYFVNEYLAYLVLQERIDNRLNLSLDAQRQYYDQHKEDFWLSPTVSLRVIRVRTPEKMTSAVAALKGGKPFEQVELEFSEVSPRYRGRVLGPFPSAEERTMIPPPQAVIDAAMATPDGQTTGPLQSGEFQFLVKAEAHTPGRQQTLDDVAEKVEEALRVAQSAALVPALVDEIQKELNVAVDEQLFATGTNPQDQLATVGAVRILRQEYTDLNGAVRGPATGIANMMPTPLKRFILPYMIGEWARVHQFMDRPETRRALYYFDLQHLAERVADQLGDQLVPLPSDDDLRRIFQKHIAEYRKPGQPEPRFEDHKGEILDAISQQRIPEVEKRVAQAVLSKIHFQPAAAPISKNITALEALVAAKDQLPADARLLEMTPALVPSDASGATAYSEIGRAPSWRITYAPTAGGVAELVVNGPAPLLNSDDDYTSIPAFSRLKDLWRFDTDSLKRHAIDKALGNFIAKYRGQVRAVATVEFAYSKDDPTSPTDCLITYSATPADGQPDGVLMRYSAYSGEVTKRRVGEPEGKCPTCPTPDLPAPAVVNRGSSATQAQSSPGANKGE